MSSIKVRWVWMSSIRVRWVWISSIRLTNRHLGACHCISQGVVWGGGKRGWRSKCLWRVYVYVVTGDVSFVPFKGV